MAHPTQCGNCRSCQEPVTWARREYYERGRLVAKWLPFNLDGTSHVFTCPRGKALKRYPKEK